MTARLEATRTERRLRSALSPRAPAGRVGLADELGVRDCAHRRANIELLVPLDRSAYAYPGGLPVPFTDSEWTRLEAAFPDGVCDWSQPGVGLLPLVYMCIRF